MLLDEVGRLLPPDAWLVTYNGRASTGRFSSRDTGWRGGRPPLPDTSICCRMSAACSAIGSTTPASARSSGCCSASPGPTTSTAGRSPVAIWGSCAAGRHSRSPPSFGTTTKTCVRSLASSRTWTRRWATLRRGSRRRAGTWPASPVPSDANGGSRRLSTASTALARDPGRSRQLRRRSAPRAPEEPWWSPRRRADFGGRPDLAAGRAAGIGAGRSAGRGTRTGSRWIAQLLRRLGRIQEAVEAWDAIACRPGRTAVMTSCQVARASPLRCGQGDGDGGARADTRRPAACAWSCPSRRSRRTCVTAGAGSRRARPNGCT